MSLQGTVLGERSYRYSSGSYAADLTVDDLGLVATYDQRPPPATAHPCAHSAPAAWTRTGDAEGFGEPSD